MTEKTFAMIKPDAVKKQCVGNIIDMIERAQFNIVRMEKRNIDKKMAAAFYHTHASKPFFGELVDFIVSGPVILMVLEKENAIKKWRELMGATNPKEWAEGTIRKRFGSSIGENAVHGSDAPETAAQEIQLFFPGAKK